MTHQFSDRDIDEIFTGYRGWSNDMIEIFGISLHLVHCLVSCGYRICLGGVE